MLTERCSRPAAVAIAFLCAGGGTAHLAGFVNSGASPGLHGWSFAAMALVCLFCAVHLLRSRSRQALLMSVAMAAVMLVAHLGYLLASTPSFGAVPSAHAHLALAAAPSSQHALHATLSSALLVPMVAEFLVLAVAAPVLRRMRVLA